MVLYPIRNPMYLIIPYYDIGTTATWIATYKFAVLLDRMLFRVQSKDHVV